ncbi:YraN family protein [Tumebacillus sp. DT12]|uniref:UPF0102 protein OS242_00675 n=1 Tax=Tumebacillus lacus TaxID=2995335 RepID=A0ABT3WV19_9BACL|nr:YraN family protein [Tumebacillus lacus]MCX7568479.1 YraN family protein [Tumebacillus lacus]
MTVTDPRKQTGARGEAFAADYLAGYGYRILDRNWRRAGGEIDLIAVIGDTLVFIEVRTRTSRAYGSAEESVDARKQRQVRKVAALYLVEAGRLPFRRFRFDVIAVQLDRRTGELQTLRHLEDAF